MLSIENHKLVQLHFNHVLKSTGEVLPIVIRPVCPEKDLAAKKAILAYDRPRLLGNNDKINDQALFELKSNYTNHYDENELLYAWAITTATQTWGFLDYQLQSTKSIECEYNHHSWFKNIIEPNYNVLCRSIYLRPDAQGEGIGSVACAVANDFLFSKNIVKPQAILAEKFSDNKASLALTKPCEGWQHAVSDLEYNNQKETYILLKENYTPSAKLVPYDIVLPENQGPKKIPT